VPFALLGVPALALVEAKAHENELDSYGKRTGNAPSVESQANHVQIGRAIEEARVALDRQASGVSISRDTCYQISNRVAHAWKIASLGLPVVLMYLGFTGDDDVGRGFKDADHWDAAIRSHMRSVLPDAFADRWLPCGRQPMYMMIRSRPAMA
jgi:hypothetical protein